MVPTTPRGLRKQLTTKINARLLTYPGTTMYSELDFDQQLQITRSLMNTLEDWGLDAESKVALLGLPDSVRTRMLRRYQDDTPFPVDDQVCKHLEQLAGIADALRTTYPRSPQMGTRWLKRPCRQFRGQQPLTLMIDGGINGMMQVRRHLDCTYAWDQSGSST